MAVIEKTIEENIYKKYDYKMFFFKKMVILN